MIKAAPQLSRLVPRAICTVGGGRYHLTPDERTMLADASQADFDRYIRLLRINHAGGSRKRIDA